jgi:hypothetical protein
MLLFLLQVQPTSQIGTSNVQQSKYGTETK